jgi:hypothetical protein
MGLGPWTGGIWEEWSRDPQLAKELRKVEPGDDKRPQGSGAVVALPCERAWINERLTWALGSAGGCCWREGGWHRRIPP